MPKALPVQLQELEAKPEKTAEDLARIEELKAKIAGKATPPKPKVEDKTETKPEAPTKPEVKPKEKFKEGETDFVDYQRFAAFKHMMWNKDKKAFIRKQLKEKVLVEYDRLEKKFKDYPGEKPKFTKTVFLEAGIANARIVEGYAVPESLYQQFKDAKKHNHYF